MPNYTITQLRSVGIQPASGPTQTPGGVYVLDYEFDGAKRSTVANDTMDLFEIPAFAMAFVDAAALTTLRAGTASSTFSITIGASGAAGTAVTGLTAWAADATAGTELVKLGTGNQSNASSASSNFVKLQVLTGGAGTGRYRLRVFLRLYDSAPSVPAN